MKDQVMALRWVRDNIEAFGGDHNSVTIFGESAGAGSTQLHATSPLSRDLFHRGISQSGSSMCGFAVSRNATHLATRVGHMFNCTTSSSNEMINCLRNVDKNVLVTAQLRLSQWFGHPQVHFNPVIEHHHPSAFLAELPEISYRNQRVSKVPWIFDFNDTEWAWQVAPLMLIPNRVSDVNQDWERIGPLLLNLRNPSEDNPKMAR